MLFISSKSKILKDRTFWLIGVIIFFLMEAILNYTSRFFSLFDRNLLVILLLYIIYAIIGSTIVSYLIAKTKLRNVNKNCFSISVFITGTLFLYSFMWINDKNPDVVSSIKSIIIDIILFSLCLAAFFAIYSFFIWLKSNKNLMISYLSFSIAFSFYIIYMPSFNWERYRGSVYKLNKFLEFNTLLYNIYILVGSFLLFIAIYYLLLFFRILFQGTKYTNLKKIFIASLIFIIFLGWSIFFISKKSVDNNVVLNQRTHTINKPNIILFIVDAVRAEHLSSYGYKRNTSPNIDKLAEEGILFENCISQSPLSRLSILAILTSRYPTFSAMTDYDYIKSLVRLQEILQSITYKTAAFVGENQAYNIMGLDKGFNYFFNPYGNYNNFFLSKIFITFLNVISDYPYRHMIPYEKIGKDLFSWLEKNRNNRFFIYIHSEDTHAPYMTPESYKNLFYKGSKNSAFNLGEEWRIKQDKISSQKIKDIIDLYDDAIRYADENIKKLIYKLEELDIVDNTLLIITADHGEAFLEHNTTHHGRSLFEEMIKVPLIFYYPKLFKGNVRVQSLVSNLDVIPTILDTLNVNIDKKLDGKSFLPLILNNKGKIKEFRRFVFSGKEGNFDAIRTLKWKLIFSDESKREYFGTNLFGHKAVRELYNLESDPLELNNVYNKMKDNDEIIKLEKELIRHINFMKNN